MKGSSVFVFSYFIDGFGAVFRRSPLLEFLVLTTIFIREIGVQPFEGDPYSKWMEFFSYP